MRHDVCVQERWLTESAGEEDQSDHAYILVHSVYSTIVVALAPSQCFYDSSDPRAQSHHVFVSLSSSANLIAGLPSILGSLNHDSRVQLYVKLS